MRRSKHKDDMSHRAHCACPPQTTIKRMNDEDDDDNNNHHNDNDDDDDEGRLPPSTNCGRGHFRSP